MPEIVIIVGLLVLGPLWLVGNWVLSRKATDIAAGKEKE
jgi:hypothetical protein